MATCFVKEGACGAEVLIKAKKISQTKISLEFVTICKYINKLANQLQTVNIGEALSQPMLETIIYKEAAGFCCRNSCTVPAAIFKAIEAESSTFKPKSSSIEFIESI